MLGVGELLGMASTSVLFAILGVVGDAAQTSLFYVLVVVSACFAVGWAYVLRLVQPALATRLERVGPATGWRLARRVLGSGVAGGGTALVVLGVVGWPERSAGWVAVTALCVEMMLFGVITAAVVVLENIDARGRRWSAAGAVAQFGTVAATGWWLVPAAGAAGAFGALCLGELVKATVLRQVAARTAAPVTTTKETR